VSFPSKYKTEEEIKEYYRKEYRTAPQANGLFTGERKLQYHEFFLTPLFKSWKEAGITKPVVGEIGSAFGMFLNWVRSHFPEADLHGTELTQTYRRIAFHEYGLRLDEDFDTSKKYDLITSYHVLEHQIDPDKKLKEYAACLKDSGVFYLACPIWFRELANGANIPGFDLDYYWAPDHINGWSEEHLEYIIAKAGLEIVFKDTEVYGNTYILKKTTKEAVKPEFKTEKYESFVKMAKEVWLLMQDNKNEEVMKMWPNTPSAWINYYEYNRAKFDKNRPELDALIKSAIGACKNSSDMLLFGADILSRYERYDEAFECLVKALEKKPNHPTILLSMSNCYRMKAKKTTDEKLKKELLLKSLNILRRILSVSAESLPQVLSWIYHDESNLAID
jgi:SAM-dependent methyltransferase